MDLSRQIHKRATSMSPEQLRAAMLPAIERVIRDCQTWLGDWGSAGESWRKWAEEWLSGKRRENSGYIALAYCPARPWCWACWAADAWEKGQGRSILVALKEVHIYELDNWPERRVQLAGDLGLLGG
jgi:hypothetical protein